MKNILDFKHPLWCSWFLYFSGMVWLLMFWDNISIPCSRAKQSRKFWTTWFFKMEPIGCLETSVRNYHYILRNFPEECRSHLLHGRSLKSCMCFFSLHRELSGAQCLRMWSWRISGFRSRQMQCWCVWIRVAYTIYSLAKFPISFYVDALHACHGKPEKRQKVST